MDYPARVPAAPPSPDPAYTAALSLAGTGSLAGLETVEKALRRLHPPELEGLPESLEPLLERLAEAREALADATAPAGLEPFHERFLRGTEAVEAALQNLSRAGEPGAGVGRVLGAMRLHCRAQEAFYPLRGALTPLGRWFAEPSWHERLAALDPPPPEGVSVGIHAAGADDDPDARGGFHLYVPERYTPDRDWPLVVALHGGFGHGRDFLWTWLREARSRGLFLLAPTSRRTTWALEPPDVDEPALRSMVDFVAERWRIDPDRILLTGLSDGATYSLLAGLAEEAPYTAIAPVSGVLHPQNFANGNLDRAAGRRIYLVHGALDWMFPVEVARAAAETLERSGADLVYREIEDLSHAYPREENAAILEWFDPASAPA